MNGRLPVDLGGLRVLITAAASGIGRVIARRGGRARRPAIELMLRMAPPPAWRSHMAKG